MKYGEYLDTPALSSFPDFASKLTTFGRDAARQVMLKSHGALTQEQRKRADRVWALPAHAHRDAQLSVERFPVVIYHAGAGGSFEENSVLFEFLASHGYVVVSSAYQSSIVDAGNNFGGSQQSIRDMQFLLNEMSRFPLADFRKSAGIGHSAGAQILLEWIGNVDCPLTAVVSLDTTLEYTPERFDGHRQLRKRFASLTPPRIPVLLFASAERNPNFGTFDQYLQSAGRYEASIRGLRHDDYITHGLMGAVIADREAVRKGYEEMCKTILAFLDAYLKSDDGAMGALTRKTDPIVSIRYKPRR